MPATCSISRCRPWNSTSTAPGPCTTGARLYTGQLNQGENYTTLQNTYSINFLNFNLLDLPDYQSRFLILEKDHPDVQLTDKFQMVFFELPKFTRTLEEIDDNLGLWLYIIKHTSSLDEAAMRTIVDKNPIMKETLKDLRTLSIDPQLLSIEEMRRKGELDYNTNMLVSREQGRAEGEAKGRAEGKAEGRAEGRIESARAMLQNDYSLQEVSEITGLSPEQLSDAGLIR